MGAEDNVEHRRRARERSLRRRLAPVLCAALVAGTAAAGALFVAKLFRGAEDVPAGNAEADAAALEQIFRGGNAPVPAPGSGNVSAGKSDAFGEKFSFDAALLHGEKEASSAAGAPFALGSGDLFGAYGGGRPFVSDASGRDNRLWLDASLPLEISPRAKLYLVSTLTLGEADAAAERVSDYSRSYGLGGGFGVSFRITPAAELNFDFRRTRAVEGADAEQEDPHTNSAGVSLKIRF